MLGLTTEEVFWTLGVTNVCVSAWLAGAFPYCYWVYHVFKFGLLLMLRCYKSLAVDHKLNIIEYCYLVNYLFFLYYILSLSIQDSWDLWYYDISYYLFRILFTACVGPLALSVLAFRNSVVFHNIDHLTSTVLHWTPQVSIWGMRWWVNDLERTFPNIFRIGCGEPSAPHQWSVFFDKNVCSGSFVDLWAIPAAVYFLLYSIPYGIIVFYCARKSLHEKGYAINFELLKNKPPLKNLLKIGGESYKPLKYTLIHGTFVVLTFLLGPLMWHSFALHTIYLVAILVKATINGATYHNRVFVKLKIKEFEMAQLEMKKQEEDEGYIATDDGDSDNHGGENHHSANNYTLNGEIAIMNLFNRIFSSPSSSSAESGQDVQQEMTKI